MRQDMNGVRTAQDLERKYDFSLLKKNEQAIQLQKESLTKVDNELSNFVEQTLKDIGNLQDQVDGNIMTWFFDGTPTLDNVPANEWITDDIKNQHLGDLYYDQQTGYAYRFTFQNNSYDWFQIQDTDVTKALALANSAQDTADAKRRIFVNIPTTPYDVGDLWIKDKELYICQLSKPSTEQFDENDFIIATKYTDDTKAEEVDGKLTVVSGQVLEVKKGVDELSSKITATTEVINEQGDKITTLETKQTEFSQTTGEIQLSVSQTNTRIDGLAEDMTNNYYTKEESDANLTVENDIIRQSVSDLTKMLKDGYTTTEDLENVITQTVQETTNLISQTGGFNLLKNSQFYQNADEWVKGETTTLSVNYGTTDVEQNTTSKSELKLSNGSIRQSYSTIIGKEYTVAFKYKKQGTPNKESSVKLFNGANYIDVLVSNNQVANRTEVAFTYKATTNNPEIIITTDQDDFYISDLVIQSGTSTEWSQNANETRGLGHTLTGSELTIYNVGTSGEKVKIDPNSIEYYDGATLKGYYSKTEMRTEKGAFDEEAIVCGLTFKKINESEIILS